MNPTSANKTYNKNMIKKPEVIKKRITKAVSKGQSTLLIGEWEEDLITRIKENNSIKNISLLEISNQLENSFTRIIIDYSMFLENSDLFYREVRKLLLPTGMLIVSANSEPGFFEKVLDRLTRKNTSLNLSLKIKPKVLQDQIHDNGFLIDGYYGYPGGDILMMAIIQNKEVSTLFTSKNQETITNKI